MPPERKRSVVISALFRMVRQEKHLALQSRSKVTGRVVDRQTVKSCSQGRPTISEIKVKIMTVAILYENSKCPGTVTTVFTRF